MTTHTFDSPTADASRSPSAVARFLHTFRYWRKGRPFPAGLLIILAGIELWLAPLSSIGTIIHEGIGGISAFFIGALMMMFGLTVWVAPAYRVFAGIASILLGLIALPATNLGGFFLGTLLALIGGGLATSWVPRPGWAAPTRGERRRSRRAAHASEASGTYVTEAQFAEAGTAEHAEATATLTLPSVAEQELAALEARVNEPVRVRHESVRRNEKPTADLPEVENTGADESPKG